MMKLKVMGERAPSRYKENIKNKHHNKVFPTLFITSIVVSVCQLHTQQCYSSCYPLSTCPVTHACNFTAHMCDQPDGKGLAARLHIHSSTPSLPSNHPMFLTYIFLSLMALFKSYPCVGDVTVPLALLPLWTHTFRCEKLLFLALVI